MFFIACRPAKHNIDIVMKEFIVIIGSIPKGGIKPETVQEFREAARLLIDRGFFPLNPFSRHRLFFPLGFDRLPDNEYIFNMRNTQYSFLLDSIFLDIRLCDAVYLLDSYAEDPIGYALLAMAHALGKKIYRSDRFFSPYSDLNQTLSFSCSRTYIAHRLPERCET